MTTEESTTETEESGKEFRAKFEAQQAENRALREAYAGTFKYVKADDLAGIPAAEFAAKAQELEQARKAERELIAKEVLAERGVQGEDLDSALSALTQQQQGEVQEDPQALIAALGQLSGTPVSQRSPTDGKFGIDRVRAALQ